MTIGQERSGTVLVLSPTGRLDRGGAAEAEAEILGHIERGERRLVLDLAGLDYVSSAGLRTVLVIAKRLRQEQGAIVLCGFQPHVRDVFEISGFLSILDVADTRQDAVTKLTA